MTCNNANWIRPNETYVDAWGGSVQLIAIAGDLNSVLITVQAPWGEVDSYIEIDKGDSRTYIKSDKTYTVHCTSIACDGDKCAAKLHMCYDFVTKLNTTTSVVYDGNASQLYEGGKLFFDCKITDENGVVLEHYDAQIYKNGVWVGYAPGVWRYEHIITADDIGKTLVFQGKFDGTEGFNPSQSLETTIVIPGKAGTSLSISVDKTTIAVGRTVSFTGVLKDDKGVEISNQTVYLVYRGVNGGYGYVLDKDGFKIIASTDINGKYYRPWEPLEKYLDFDEYAMYFEGNNNYNSCYSPDLLLNVIPDTCTQNIQILDVKYNPVPGVTVKMNDVSKVTDVGGNVSFPDIQRDQAYIVYKTLDTYSGSDDNVIGCKFDPQILHVIVPSVCPIPVLTGIEVI